MRSLYHGYTSIGDSLQSLLLLVLRLYWGFAFFLAGFGKIQNIEPTVDFFGTLGIPFPEFMAPFVAWMEAVGGICLLVGFASRVVALPLAIIMIVALFTAHSEATLGVFQDPQRFINQTAFNFLLTTLIVFCFGPGKISVDYLLERSFSRKQNP
jgi:putative oxidoreductase